MLKFLNENAGAITAVFTIVVAASTVVYAFLTHALVRENRLVRKHQTQPALAIYVTPSDRWLNVLELVIRNSGGSVALNIRWTVEPRPTDLAQYGFAINSLALFDGLTHLTPGQEVRTFLGSALELLQDPVLEELRISASYEDARGQELITSVSIKVRQFEGINRLGSPPLDEVADSLKKVASVLASAARFDGRIRVTIATEAEIKAENERRFEAARSGEREA